MKKFIPALCALLLASCMDAPPSTVMPDLTFAGAQPVVVDAGKIDVVDQYKPAMKAPNIDHLFKPTPVDALQRLLAKGLSAGGSGKTLHVIIEDASAVDEKLPSTQGFWGNFTQEPSDRYKAHVAIRFQLTDDAAPDVVTAHAAVAANRSRVILKDSSPADRDRAALALTEELMADVSDGLKTVVKDTFGKK